MARSRRGRDAQPAAAPTTATSTAQAAATGRRLLSHDLTRMVRGPCCLLLALAVACARPRLPAPPPLIALSTTTVETREVQLDNDLITVRLHIPPTAERRKPTVISMLGDRTPLLRQGLLVV